MASTYSTNLAIELIGTGDQAGAWGNTTNTNLGTLIEQAISGYVTQAVSTGTDTTITIPNGATGVARNMYIELTGTGGASTNLIVPANKKLYFIFNNASGAVTVKVSGQTGVSVPAGKKVVLASNGTDTVNALNYIADFGSNSATITQLTATSATITNLTLTSLVISNLSIASANITTLTSSSATISTTLALSGGTANGVLYLNGSKVATSGSAITFDGTNLALTGTAPIYRLPAAGGYLFDASGNTGFYVQQTSSALLGFYTGGTEQMRLTSTGLGIGTSSPSGFLANKLVIATGGTANEGMTIYSSSNNGSIWFADATTGTGRYAGGLDYTHSDDTLIFYSAAQGNMRLNASGNLGLGVTPSASWGSTVRALQIGSSSVFRAGDTGFTQATVVASNAYQAVGTNYYLANGFATEYAQQGGTHYWSTAASGTAGNTITFTQAMTLNASGSLALLATSGHGCELDLSANGTSANKATFGFGFATASDNIAFLYNRTNNALVFGTNNTERARITSGGNVGIGTTSPELRLHVVGSNGDIFRVAGANENFYVNCGSQGSYVGNGASAGGETIYFNAVSDYMAFFTASTERARITSGGYSKFSDNGTYLSASGTYHEFYQSANSEGLRVYTSNSSTYNSDTFKVDGERATTNSTYNLGNFRNGNGTGQCIIRDSGNVVNTNNSYGQISDVKTKQDIVDAVSQWDDIKAIKVRKFRFKSNPDGALQIGVIAQELESVSPGLVDENPDYEEIEITDKEGNTKKERQATGTKTKSVKYSVLYMKAVKALQEAMARIEKLEVEVAALKGA